MQLTKGQRAGINGAATFREIIRRTGKTAAGGAVWAAAEDAVLKASYPDYNSAASALPNRTRKALECRVARLGIANKLRVWSDGEFRAMAPPYREGRPVEAILPKLSGKTSRQVYAKAGKHKVRRPRKRPKLTGIGIVDSIRQRAFDLNFTLSELDAATGGGSYFQSPRSVRWPQVSRAVKLLGGRVAVAFNDAPT